MEGTWCHQQNTSIIIMYHPKNTSIYTIMHHSQNTSNIIIITYPTGAWVYRLFYCSSITLVLALWCFAACFCFIDLLCVCVCVYLWVYICTVYLWVYICGCIYVGIYNYSIYLAWCMLRRYRPPFFHTCSFKYKHQAHTRMAADTAADA